MSHSQTARAARKLLLVDDNADAAALLGELLGSMGHEVQVAHDGPSALAQLDSFTPEVALLDIGLPGMSGYELARLLRERLGAGCRLIALTGYAAPRELEARARDFHAYLVKPISPARLLSLLDEIVC